MRIFAGIYTGRIITGDGAGVRTEALDELFPCCGNASLMIHEENVDSADVVEYMIDVGLSTILKLSL